MAKPESSAATTPSRSRNYELYGAMGIAMVGLGVFKRKRVSDGEEIDATISNNHYRDTITRLEGLGNHFLNGDHRFVGGILPLKYHRENGVLILDTQARFDFKRHEIYLTNNGPLELIRQDKTVRDIDIVNFSNRNYKKNRYLHYVKNLRKKADKNGLPHPHIGVESAFIPRGRKRIGALQFVTADEVDKQGNHYLAFDNHKIRVNPLSLEPWKVILDDGTFFTMLNPYAQVLRYKMRVLFCGLKSKDRKSDSYHAQKVLARQFLSAGIYEGINYDEIHKEWKEYLDALKHKKNILTMVKTFLTYFYWSTFGTAIAHGKGILKPFSGMTTIFKG